MGPPSQRREQRGAPRVPATLNGRCRIGNRFLRDVVMDVSETGLYLRTREPAKPGTPVRVALALPFPDGPRICTFAGEVARSVLDARGLPTGLGVRFVREEIAAGDLEALHAFIRAQPAESPVRAAASF